MFDIIGEGCIIDCDYFISVPFCSYPRPTLRKQIRDNGEILPVVSIDIGNMQ